MSWWKQEGQVISVSGCYIIKSETQAYSLSLPLPLLLFVSGIPCLWLLLFADTSIMKRLYYCLSAIDSTPALVHLGFPSYSPRGTQPGLAFGALLYLTATGVPPSGGGGVYVLQNIPACCPCLRPCQRTCCRRLCFTTSGSSDIPNWGFWWRLTAPLLNKFTWETSSFVPCHAGNQEFKLSQQLWIVRWISGKRPHDGCLQCLHDPE